MAKIAIDKEWLEMWAKNWSIPKQAIDDFLEHCEIVPEPQHPEETQEEETE